MGCSGEIRVVSRPFGILLGLHHNFPELFGLPGLGRVDLWYVSCIQHASTYDSYLPAGASFARRAAAPPPNVALLAPEDNQSSAFGARTHPLPPRDLSQ